MALAKSCALNDSVNQPRSSPNTFGSTNQSNVATSSDLLNATLTLVKGSDLVLANMPINMLNPFVYTNTANTNAAGQTMREILLSQVIDWNQSYIYMQSAPSSNPIIFSLGVYYYDSNKPIKTM